MEMAAMVSMKHPTTSRITLMISMQHAKDRW